VYAERYTPGVAKTVPIRDLRASLAEYLDEVVDRREHVIVTRHGRPAAALIPLDEYEGLEETADILSDPDALDAIDAGLADLEAGKTISLAELRRHIKRRRR
jgi:antitoxin YefM